jgi:CRISPR system Cascade subunit CasC
MENGYIAIHMIQNHPPSNLNRDDIGAPKTAYFGGCLRARISSQCLKRSIRRSEEFARHCGGIRTRRLIELLAKSDKEQRETVERALKELDMLDKGDSNTGESDKKTKATVFISVKSVHELRDALKNTTSAEDFKKRLKKELQKSSAPDIALFGRMLETTQLSDTRVEAAAHVAHALSTHECMPEVDYYVAADDIPGPDAGAAYVDESLFTSACFYKFFVIDWNQLLNQLGKNLPDQGSDVKFLAASTIVAFLKAAALTNPSGKQTSYAPHTPPAMILVERCTSPLNYANAFAAPVRRKEAPEEEIIIVSCRRLVEYAKNVEKTLNRSCDRWLLDVERRLPQLNQEDPKFAELCEDLDGLLGAVAKSLLGFEISLDELMKHVLQENERLAELLKEQGGA